MRLHTWFSAHPKSSTTNTSSHAKLDDPSEDRLGVHVSGVVTLIALIARFCLQLGMCHVLITVEASSPVDLRVSCLHP